MKNLVFVIWMLGFPLIESITRYLCYASREAREELDTLAKGIVGLILCFIYFYVGYLLYE